MQTDTTEAGRRTQTVTATEAVRRFGDLMNAVHYRGERVLITKHGRPVAEIVPFEDAGSDPAASAEAAA